MMRILSEMVVTLSASAVMSLMIKGTAVVASGLVSAWLGRRGRAAVRHALLASAFGVLLALPVVSWIAPPVTISVPVAASDSVILPLFDFNLLLPLGQNAWARLGAASAQQRSPLRSLAATPLSTLMLYGWFVGIALFAIPVIRGLLQVRSLRRFGLPWRHGQAVAERLAPRSRRAVKVLIHESLPGPMTCGVLRPLVMLPEDAPSWDEKDLERALVHELEHVRRYDWAIHCVARVACAAYWFHPLVWAAWRQLTLEAERSCDDAVLGIAEATAYADQLLGLARKRSAVRRSPALAMANRSDLAARIGALLDRRQSRGPVGALLVAVACAVAVAIVLTMAPLRMVAAPRSSTPGAVQSIPKWDAVSIRRCASAPVAPVERRSAGVSQSPDRQIWNCVHVSTLINQAYSIFAGGQSKLPPYPAPIERLPSWADSERYTIEAKPQGNPGAGIMRGPMLQALLEDRFALKIRRETREGRVYLMTVAKGGSRLLPFQGGCTPFDLVHIAASMPAIQNPCRESHQSKGPNVTIDIPGLDVDSFALYITHTKGFDGPVWNKTGLTGYFHFHLEFPSNGKPGDPGYMAADDSPSLFTAMQQQLGLKVEAGKGPREFLVVDHLDKPSAN
jgi:bla regulator protein blaR1